jgi:hypothetical protein
MILQLGSLAHLIGGIAVASDNVDEETKKGNFESWYQ